MPCEMQRIELLVRVPQPPWVIDDERASAKLLQHQRDVEVLHIKRRVLADENGLDVCKSDVLWRAKLGQ